MQITSENVNDFSPDELADGITTGKVNLAELAIPILTEIVKSLAKLLGTRSRLKHRIEDLETITKTHSEILTKLNQ